MSTEEIRIFPFFPLWRPRFDPDPLAQQANEKGACTDSFDAGPESIQLPLVRPLHAAGPKVAGD